MYRIEFCAHNATEWQYVDAWTTDGATQICSALNYTCFSFRVMRCGLDLTDQICDRITRERFEHRACVAPVAGGIPEPREASPLPGGR